MAEPVRVLVVDDSSFFRKRIKSFLEQSNDIRVIGEAADGEEAVRMTHSLAPDLITMDVAMPRMDGIEAVRRIMREKPTRIVMFSALTREGARATLDALDAGAMDFLPKSSEAEHGESAGPVLRQRVLEIAHGSGQVSRRGQQDRKPPRAAAPVKAAAVAPPGGNFDLVVIGASTGGPVAVQQILASLPSTFPYPVLVAVHMPGTFTNTYAERLNSVCKLTVHEAQDGAQLQRGNILIAPGGQQTLVARNGSGLRVRLQPPGEYLYKPCIDVSFGSAAKAVGKRVLAIVLTGMGSDGASGAAELKRAGAQVWAQDQESSVVYGMPQAVARAGVVDRVLPLTRFAEALKEV